MTVSHWHPRLIYTFIIWRFPKNLVFVVSLCLIELTFFSSVVFYSFIHEHSVIKFATLTLDASDHIIKGPNTFLLFSKYMPFYSFVKTGCLWMRKKKKKENKGGIIHLDEKLWTPFVYLMPNQILDAAKIFNIEKGIKLDFKICPIILINLVWKALSSYHK